MWEQFGGSDSPCPPEKVPTFSQLDDLISTTAWGAEAHEDFFRRWIIVEKACDETFDRIGSIAQLAHMTWAEVNRTLSDVKHPLAPLITLGTSRPAEVESVPPPQLSSEWTQTGDLMNLAA